MLQGWAAVDVIRIGNLLSPVNVKWRTVDGSASVGVGAKLDPGFEEQGPWFAKSSTT